LGGHPSGDEGLPFNRADDAIVANEEAAFGDVAFDTAGSAAIRHRRVIASKAARSRVRVMSQS